MVFMWCKLKCDHLNSSVDPSMKRNMLKCCVGFSQSDSHTKAKVLDSSLEAVVFTLKWQIQRVFFCLHHSRTEIYLVAHNQELYRCSFQLDLFLQRLN